MGEHKLLPHVRGWATECSAVRQRAVGLINRLASDASLTAIHGLPVRQTLCVQGAKHDLLKALERIEEAELQLERAVAGLQEGK